MAPPSTIKIVGTGLLGTSLGLRLTQAGVSVLLADASPTMAALARDLGAGRLDDGAEPDLVVIAAPPDVVGGLVASSLRDHPDATVTDVASIKSEILAEVRSLLPGDSLERYIGSHPMAGREKSGAVAARADLFIGRPWVICTDEATPPERLAQIEELARTVGAAPIHLDPKFHDAAVARVSHAPQVLASLMAAQLREAPIDAVALAGQGLRDVTRIAASDPGLWAQILSGNAAEVRSVLTDIRAELDTVIGALGGGVGSVGSLASLIAAGNEGHDRIPGKHGQAPTRYATVTILIPDSPGNMGRLFTDVGEIGVNIEDVRMEHAAGQLLGIVEVDVLPVAQENLIEGLTVRGWQVPTDQVGTDFSTDTGISARTDVPAGTDIPAVTGIPARTDSRPEASGRKDES